LVLVELILQQKVVLVAVGGKVMFLQLVDLVAVGQVLVLAVLEHQDKVLLVDLDKVVKVVHI
jgi:hypothetical protein